VFAPGPSPKSGESETQGPRLRLVIQEENAPPGGYQLAISRQSIGPSCPETFSPKKLSFTPFDRWWSSKDGIPTRTDPFSVSETRPSTS